MRKPKVHYAQIIKRDFRVSSHSWGPRLSKPSEEFIGSSLRKAVDANCYVCVGKPKTQESWFWLIGSCQNKDCFFYSVRNKKFREYAKKYDRPANIKDLDFYDDDIS